MFEDLNVLFELADVIEVALQVEVLLHQFLRFIDNHILPRSLLGLETFQKSREETFPLPVHHE